MSRPQENPGRKLRKERQRRKKRRKKYDRYARDKWKTSLNHVTPEVRS